jgi:hypothetical protein
MRDYGCQNRIFHTGTETSDSIQMNSLTVIEFVNTADSFRFSHGMLVVNRVGHVGSRKSFAFRKETGMQ